MATFNDNYFSFQGKIYLFKRTAAGLPGGGWFIGNSPKSEFQPSVERREHKESYSGQRLVDKIQTTKKGAKLIITLEDIQKKNLELAFAGTSQNLSGSYSSSSYDTFPAGLAVGQLVKLKQFNVSSLVIKDSAGSPTTLTLNTHYEIVSAKDGLVKILDLTGLTQPLKSQYTYASTDIITGMTASDDDEYWVYCDLINTEPSTDQAIGIEIFRCVFDPAKTLSLITDDQGQIEIEANVLRDNVNADDANYGGFFRWIYGDANL